ncbi:MAG: helix-turn-helix domain-containing protein [Actinobacteria bacterium]|nr:helix-turn-helix domain-containing protein [Actinomycetota bacterium]NBR66250.1 helix-turn-helix domain-containing protein [Actinomycetota bacterium]
MPRNPADRLHDVGEFIRQQRENAQQSIRDLARAAGVSNPYLSQIERGIRRPSAEILQQIARALEISAESLYVRAGILDGTPPAASSVPEAIMNDERLTAEQRQSLLSVYRSFVASNDQAGTGPADGNPPSAG